MTFLIFCKAFVTLQWSAELKRCSRVQRFVSCKRQAPFFDTSSQTAAKIGCCESKPRVRKGRKRKWTDSEQTQFARPKLTHSDAEEDRHATPLATSLLCWRRGRSNSASLLAADDVTNCVAERKSASEALVCNLVSASFCLFLLPVFAHLSF